MTEEELITALLIISTPIIFLGALKRLSNWKREQKVLNSVFERGVNHDN